ncbi:TPA: hypothetical protein ACH3X2_006693 [Trebouxia sp. C0005]
MTSAMLPACGTCRKELSALMCLLEQMLLGGNTSEQRQLDPIHMQDAAGLYNLGLGLGASNKQ